MIGIFGGTFDPIHNGHLRLALEAVEQLGLSRVHFIPLGMPTHRNPPLASAACRLEMVECAIATESAFVADDREIRRGGPSYTLDTLESLRADMPTESLVLLLGGDAWRSFPRWHAPGQIRRLAHIAVFQRPGEIMDLGEAGSADALSGQAGGLVALHTTQLAISSSEIRGLIASGRSIRFLVPDSVFDCIRRWQLYQAD